MAFQKKSPASNKPYVRMDALTVREYESEGETKSSWLRLGVAFMNSDGTGKIILDGLPVNGTIILRPPYKKDEE